MSKPQRHIFVCAQARPPGHPRGSCSAGGAVPLLQAFQQAFEAQGLWGRFAITNSGCLGPCQLGPNVLVYPDGILYSQVQVSDVPAIIAEHLLGGTVVVRLQAPSDVWS